MVLWFVVMAALLITIRNEYVLRRIYKNAWNNKYTFKQFIYIIYTL